MYKAYVMNCKLSKLISRSKQQHIHFLGNCVTELYRVDTPSAYQHAFVFIRQLAALLRGALTERGNKVDKTTIKTRGFQEACIYSVVEELAEHLAQWSYSPTFFEMVFVPLVRLRSFCKCTDVGRSRREIKELICQVEANCEFTNSKRETVDFSPNNLAIKSFLKAEKDSGSSPLSQFAAQLHLRAQQRSDVMVESSVLVGAESSVFISRLSEIPEDEDEVGEEEAEAVFSSYWLPDKKSEVTKEKPKTSKKRHYEEYVVEGDVDLVEDLVLSSDEDDDDDDKPNADSASDDEEDGSNQLPSKQLLKKKQKLGDSSMRNTKMLFN